MNQFKNSLLAVFLLISISSCDKQEDTVDLSNSNQASNLTASSLKLLDDSGWLFTNYTKNQIETEYENKITLNFDATVDDKIPYSGQSLVNVYAGSFTVKEGSGLITENDDGISSLIGTNNQRLATIEQAYYSNLAKATFFEINSDTLRIYLGDTSNTDTQIMIYKRQ